MNYSNPMNHMNHTKHDNNTKAATNVWPPAILSPFGHVNDLLRRTDTKPPGWDIPVMGGNEAACHEQNS